MLGSIVLLTGVRVTVHTSGGHQQGATDPGTGAEARLLRKTGSTTKDPEDIGRGPAAMLAFSRRKAERGRSRSALHLKRHKNRGQQC
jgi:hypothetical protein